MSKKSTKQPVRARDLELFEEYEFEHSEMVDNVLDDFMFHATETVKAAQMTALELTKLAVNHATNVDENKVFELFRRAAEEVDKIYNKN
ncbi:MULTISPECIES: hypothetical protein [Legionella]|uniref:hypothetical protein n=1 Tax=Legionella TaxID=445 RepID=UPI000F8EF24F|nr:MULTISPECIES: hypothetical protein [Legionella]MCP0914693.1 hypothetical protein [Legionella sp. 27cVA30]RUQ93522.1 hypothetical protein ELY11_11660 [Legionella septentrionalis]RUR08999.1 hypothetical protein ELY14_10105 [Legionella septentrionalis]